MMNERIKELAVQAGMVYDPEQGQFDDFDEQQFAELIVREALTKIDEVGYKSSNNISADDTELFKSVLKRHFGVEE